MSLFTYCIYTSLLVLVVLFAYLGALYQHSNLWTKDGRFLRLHFTEKAYAMTLPTYLTTYHIMALLFISFVVGFRYNVGVDWAGYKEAFEYISADKTISFFNHGWEWGYFIINRWVANLGGNYSLMFFVVAFISWLFIFKSVPAKLLPLALFFIFADEIFFWSMNGVRQFAAIGIFLYSIRFIIKRNLLTYLLLIAGATLFHFSALMLIPLYFIPFQKLYNQMFWIIAFVVSLFFSLFIPLSLDIFIVDGLRYIFSILGENFHVFQGYLTYVEYGHVQTRELSLGFGFAFKIIINLFILFFSKNVVKKHPQTKIYFVLFFIGIIAFNLFYEYQLLCRFINYFIFIRFITLSFIVYYLWQWNKTYILAVEVVLLYFFLYLTTIYNSSNLCSPYSFSFLN